MLFRSGQSGLWTPLQLRCKDRGASLLCGRDSMPTRMQKQYWPQVQLYSDHTQLQVVLSWKACHAPATALEAAVKEFNSGGCRAGATRCYVGHLCKGSLAR